MIDVLGGGSERGDGDRQEDVLDLGALVSFWIVHERRVAELRSGDEFVQLFGRMRT